MTRQERYDNFIRYYETARNNPIFFMERFYNELADEGVRLELSEDEKQELFDKYKGIPLIKDMNTLFERQKKIDALKEQGYKDWEIF